MFQEGNSFWQVRSTHGRDKIFADANTLWQAACEYFKWCDENPLQEVDFRGKDAVEVVLPKMRAYTIQGLCLFLDVNTQYFNQFENSLKGKEDDKSVDFSLICSRIRSVIYNQKFTGAASGLFNANIIARDLGLTDKKEVDANIKTEQLPDWLKSSPDGSKV